MLARSVLTQARQQAFALPVRCFATRSSVLLQEGVAGSSRTADLAAALRKAVSAQQEAVEGAGNRPSRRPSAERQAPRRRPQSEQGREARKSGQAVRRTSPSVLRRSSVQSRSQDDDPVPAARIRTDVRPTTDWTALQASSVPYTRVPYNSPGVDVDSLSAQPDPSSLRPLRDAESALRLKPLPNSFTVVQGGIKNPTPVARAGVSKGAEPLKLVGRQEAEAQSPSTSIAEEAREARMRAVREQAGGEYSRWQVQSPADATDAERDAAHAVAINDDLAPTHKFFTLDAIKRIVRQPGQKTGEKSRMH